MSTECKTRPLCGGATVCHDCLKMGVALGSKKLLLGGDCLYQQGKGLEQLVQTAWPAATATEQTAIAGAMLKGFHGIQPVACIHVTNSQSMVQHVTKKKLASLAASVGSTPINIGPAVLGIGIQPRTLTANQLSQAGLHVVHKSANSLIVRKKTPMNASCLKELIAALKQKGTAGASLATVYAEYPDACADIHSLGTDIVYVDRLWVWHASVAPPSKKNKD